MNAQTETSLPALVAQLPPPGVFKAEMRKDLDAVLAQIEEKARIANPDTSTEEGRQEIRSTAYKVARTKTALDEVGKALAAEIKAELDDVNAGRKRATEFLDRLKDQIRLPLDQWEHEENRRVADLQARVARLEVEVSALLFAPVSRIEAVLAQVRAVDTDNGTWGEFKLKAEAAKLNSIEKLEALLDQARKREAQEAELAALRKAQAERQAAEAALAAKREAEAKAAEDDGLAAVHPTSAPATEGPTLRSAVGAINFDADVAAAVPAHLHRGLADYIARGVNPGGFLLAVLQNDLRAAVFKAGDDIRIQDLRALTKFLTWSAPAECFGTAEKVRAWRDRFPANEETSA